MSEELAELKKITKILLLVNTEQLESQLSKYATTDERKRVWVLINGQSQPDELALGSGMKKRSVYDFLKILVNAELIENPYGKAPKKILEYVPASWLDLMKTETEDKKEKKGETVNEPNK